MRGRQLLLCKVEEKGRSVERANTLQRQEKGVCLYFFVVHKKLRFRVNCRGRNKYKFGPERYPQF
ncbi:hypothetical protein BN2497_10403 [Janthinobacterium sp. CG23_2]|nr:hypothetical protein BN2497_10403 [Janthinobacterium sp. CG23_2]CUU31599.1 hypothetical protein BN3177_10403 [Janthinobacterium sp. CG23_2]